MKKLYYLLFLSFQLVAQTPPDIPTLEFSFSDNGNTGYTIVGNLNDAENWAFYSDSCGEGLVKTTTESLVIFNEQDFFGNENIYARGEGVLIEGECSVTEKIFINVIAYDSSETCLYTNDKISGFVFGATPPYEFQLYNDDIPELVAVLNTNNNSFQFNNIPSGNYVVGLFDGNNRFSNSNRLELVEAFPLDLNIVLSSIFISCDGYGEFIAEATGGEAPYEHTLLENGAPLVVNTTGFFQNIPAGNYSHSVKDINDCVLVRNVSFSAPNEINSEVTLLEGVFYVEDLASQSYQWIDCDNDLEIDGATQSNFTPPDNREYKVLITSDLGCTEFSNCVSLSTLGSQTFEKNELINIYPNPSNGIIRFKGVDTNKIQIKVYNVLGELVNANEVDIVKFLDLKLASGMYFIELNSNGNKKKLKHIIK